MFHLREERIQELAGLIAAAMPPIRIEFSMDAHAGHDLAPTRRYYLRRIRWLAEAYGLGWQIDQATLGHSLDSLDDAELRVLLADMEQGRRCCVEGVGFDDAGLVRDTEMASHSTKEAHW